MTHGLIRRGNLDTDIHRGKTRKKHREKTVTYKPRRKAQKEPCLTKNQPYRSLDLSPPASRTVSQEISVV